MIEHGPLGLPETRINHCVSAHFPGTFPYFGKNFFFGRTGHEGEWLAEIVLYFANDHVRPRGIAFEYGDRPTRCICDSPCFRSSRITKQRREQPG